MVGGGNHDGVDLVAERGDHFAVVAKRLRARMQLERRGEPLGIDVAERRHFDRRMRRDAFEIGPAHAADADVRRAQFAGGRVVASLRRAQAGHCERRSGRGTGLEELATRNDVR